MAFILDGDVWQSTERERWQRTTEAARKRLPYLIDRGYLHSDNDRFNEITNYKNLRYKSLLSRLGDKVIEEQEKREQKIYQELGLKDKSIKGLNDFFREDEGMQEIIFGSLNNIYTTVANALIDTSNTHGSLSNTVVNDSKQNQIANGISHAYENALNNLTDNYRKNLVKILNNGTISLTAVNQIKELNNKKEDGSFKNADEFARAALGQWKGSLYEYCTAMCIAQLGNVKGVEVTGNSLDKFGKKVKSDVTFHTESMTIGISAKNYSTIFDEVGGAVLGNSTGLMSIHGGNSGVTFSNFLDRMDSLDNSLVQGDLSSLTNKFRQKNYYYNLINEAANQTTFKSSSPAIDFVEAAKGLAAAWFGAQLVTDTKEGNKGQAVDFLIVGKEGFIAMSSILKALKKDSSLLHINVTSTAKLENENIYKEKINAPHGPTSYSGGEVDVGARAGKEMYEGIKVSPIKLKFILNQFM